MNHPPLRAPGLRPSWLALGLSGLLTLAAPGARADIVTLGANPLPLANCPWGAIGLPGACLVQTAAQVRDTVSDFSQVRIGRGGQGSLSIGSGASLLVNRTNLATSPALIPSVPDVVVGDDIGAAGNLDVSKGGRLQIDVNSPVQGGLLVGVFAGPAGTPGPTTTMTITDGGSVTVNKIGGLGVGAAVGVGYGAGSVSSLLMDGGIDGFGNQAVRPRLDTTGNLSVGREGQGTVNLFRHADLTAHSVFLSTIGLQGQADLGVGLGSKLQAQRILAGIGLGAGPEGYDVNNPNHGSAVISTRDTGVINAAIVLGEGGTLMGTGSVGPSVLNLGGTVKPGFSPGTLHIDGSYTDVGGHIEIEIGPNGSDFIDVAGDLSLHGTSIEFRFIDGFAPAAGFSYDFIDADGSVDLADLQFSFSGLQPGFQFSVPQPGPDGVLTFIARNAGTPLPEPALPALLAAALLAAATARRLASTRRTRPHWAA